jgi:hypothetical protein
MDLGFGPGRYSEASSGVDQMRMNGAVVSIALRLGGTLFPGFVLGGGFVSNQMVNPKFKDLRTGETFSGSDNSLDLGEFQVFALYYPMPSRGLHFLLSAGYGTLSVSDGYTSRDLDMEGLVLGGGVGYDFWVSSQWSLGPAFVLTYGMLDGKNDELDRSGTFSAPVLAFTATYH